MWDGSVCNYPIRRIPPQVGKPVVVPWAAKTDWALSHDQERIDMPNQQPEPEDRNPFDSARRNREWIEKRLV
ncbi:MAG: hypothetical protein H6Q05_4475 [Acidobacteria bacterium]|nr:hypothetical protein [Acidobacteriota bacterium]